MILDYLAHVFGRLNEMKLSLQGRYVTGSEIQNKFGGLCARMGVRKARIEENDELLVLVFS